MPPSSPNPPFSKTVVLFPDTFTDYNDPQIGRAAVRVLEAAGYEVLLPRRPICCGRPLISKGLLGQAKALAQQQLEWLAPYAEAGLPIVGLEPSCLLTFRDEYPDLLDDPRAAVLARQSFMFDEFLAREIRAGRAALPFADHRPPTTDHRQETGDRRQETGDTRPETRDRAETTARSRSSSSVVRRQFLLHGHCHQKALVGTAAALELLRLIPGAEAREVDSGCCGMAGSFGYEAEHYEISQKIGERGAVPRGARAASPRPRWWRWAQAAAIRSPTAPGVARSTWPRCWRRRWARGRGARLCLLLGDNSAIDLDAS